MRGLKELGWTWGLLRLTAFCARCVFCLLAFNLLLLAGYLAVNLSRDGWAGVGGTINHLMGAGGGGALGRFAFQSALLIAMTVGAFWLQRRLYWRTLVLACEDRLAAPVSGAMRQAGLDASTVQSFEESFRAQFQVYSRDVKRVSVGRASWLITQNRRSSSAVHVLANYKVLLEVGRAQLVQKAATCDDEAQRSSVMKGLRDFASQMLGPRARCT